ncbi:unnamed protein product [Effrenium voratum]|uniref:Uncharacterized protein n=1 Tax=Effrenium voratum TaxID=2562239 RepID=A0AA36N4X8_9DINO|nr:unnamed protein product [Effrenium voratum]CAJ1438709.1 unnamed protein product [Effrenium voratum]
MRAHAAVGIDLGTSCCRIGLWRDGDVLIVPNDRGCLATPNCVGFLDCTGPVVGEAAVEQASANLANTIFAPQRLLGASFDSPWAQRLRSTAQVVKGDDGSAMYRVRDRGKERILEPGEVLAILLQQMKRQVEQCLGVHVKAAVVTVPAKYGKQQRRALQEALRMAQLEVLALVKAPTAAAIAFSLTNPRDVPRDVLVLDFGACYCDFCLLTLQGKCLCERAVGSEFVDLDSLLVKFCLTDIRLRLGLDLSEDMVAQLRLSMACESAKRKLSQWNQTRVNVEALVEGNDYCVAMSRSYFEEFCSRDIDCLLEIFDICLEESGLERNGVDVVLVGGSSRIPRFRRLVKDFFRGQQPSEVLRPDHAAVLGAAVYAARLAGNQAPDSEDDFAVDDERLPRSEAVSSGGIYSFEGLRLEEIMPWSSITVGDFPQLDEVPCNECFGLALPREAKKLRGSWQKMPSGRVVETPRRPAAMGNGGAQPP